MAKKHRSPRRKTPKKKKGEKQVNALAVIELIHGHITEALCAKVFSEERGGERRRTWTLGNLARFWMAVILRAPDSLTEILQESAQGGNGILPHVRATPEAFFQRCRDFRPVFFRRIFEEFVRRIQVDARCVY